ncbi:diacylglycerol/lipid kinase family protein [Umboniibacter marinipuniceus]|uniref:Diacylglycerol kinase family enzyme n=1 Tax=Umboniibacter marinipuniceus TaxID=569599 RepID=A0A3M0AIE1_9GAMM|nr:diacylglycerol kinase family protein [Umboniibacter marinipuniceus]RMA78932.1 diacylglycerol kinase family enzyme [Umboniibacter marinipuniceus]
MWHGFINRQSGRSGSLSKRLSRECAKHPNIEWHQTHSEQEQREQLQALVARGEQFFLVAGGDGTLHRALNAMQPTESRPLCLAPIPKGSGNDWCRSLKAPLNFSGALGLALSNPTQSIDFFKVTTDHYTALGLNSVGCGFDTQVLSYMQDNPQGRFKYWRSLLAMLKERKPVTLCFGDHQADRILLLIGKGRFAGSGMCLLPQAKLNNRTLSITEVAPLNNSELYRELPRLKTGGFISNPNVLHYQQPELHVEFDQPTALQIDGELYPPAKTLRVEVISDALRVPIYR